MRKRENKLGPGTLTIGGMTVPCTNVSIVVEVPETLAEAMAEVAAEDAMRRTMPKRATLKIRGKARWRRRGRS